MLFQPLPASARIEAEAVVTRIPGDLQPQQLRVLDRRGGNDAPAEAAAALEDQFLPTKDRPPHAEEIPVLLVLECRHARLGARLHRHAKRGAGLERGVLLAAPQERGMSQRVQPLRQRRD